ncbi:MAG: hypothetical protein ACE5JB_15995 [bacterium]
MLLGNVQSVVHALACRRLVTHHVLVCDAAQKEAKLADGQQLNRDELSYTSKSPSEETLLRTVSDI